MNKSFVLETKKCCQKTIAAEYERLVNSDEEISEDAAMQLLADVGFLEIALAGDKTEDFTCVKDLLIEKVLYLSLL